MLHTRQPQDGPRTVLALTGMPTVPIALVILRNQNRFALAIHSALLCVGQHTLRTVPCCPHARPSECHLGHGEGGVLGRNRLSDCAQHAQQHGRFIGFKNTGYRVEFIRVTASKRRFRISSNPATPSQAVCTAYPSCSNWASTRARQPASSSTTSIRFPCPSIRPPSRNRSVCGVP